jgi:hypothetical protein
MEHKEVLVATMRKESHEVLEVSARLPGLEGVEGVIGDALLLLASPNAITKIHQDLEGKMGVLEVGKLEQLHHLGRRSVTHYAREEVETRRTSGTVCTSTILGGGVGRKSGSHSIPLGKKRRKVRHRGRHLKYTIL